MQRGQDILIMLTARLNIEKKYPHLSYIQYALLIVLGTSFKKNIFVNQIFGRCAFFSCWVQTRIFGFLC